MAINMRVTSITESAASQFTKAAKERETLSCSMIPGFHLMKNKNGASWKLRYIGLNAKGKHSRKVATIGSFPVMLPKDAAAIAYDWKKDETDPLIEKEDLKHQKEWDFKTSKARTVRAYLDGRYTDWLSPKASGKQRISLIRRYFDDLLDRDMESLKRRDIQTWQKEKVEEGCSHITLKDAYSALKTMLKHAVKEEAISNNHLEYVQLDSPSPEELERILAAREKKKEQRRLLTDDELAGIFKGLDFLSEEIRKQRRNSRAHGKSKLPDLDSVTYPHWFIPFCYLDLYTGMRPGDLYTLEWKHVELTFNPHIRKTLNKTKHNPEPAEVMLSLDDVIVKMLKTWKQEQSQDTRLVFPAKNGNKKDKKSHGRFWEKVLKHGEVDKSLDFCGFRHHFISKLITQGRPLFEIARLAGHKDTNMIEKHYGHLCPDASALAMANYSQHLNKIVNNKK